MDGRGSTTPLRAPAIIAILGKTTRFSANRRTPPTALPPHAVPSVEAFAMPDGGLESPPYAHSIISELSNYKILNHISNQQARNTVKITVRKSCLVPIVDDGSLRQPLDKN